MPQAYVRPFVRVRVVGYGYGAVGGYGYGAVGGYDYGPVGSTCPTCC